MLRVIVTGGSGFIGTNLVEYLVQHGLVVLNLDIEPPRNKSHSPYWRRTDILESQDLRTVFAEFAPTHVVHMAARTDLAGGSVEEYLPNTDGVRNVIEAIAVTPSVRRTVFFSSMLVCRLGYKPRSETDYAPTTVYGASKVMGEHKVRQLNADKFPWVIVRPTSLWGPWFDVPYRNFFDAVRKGWYFHPSGVSVRRSYGFVLNCVAQLGFLLLTAAERHVCGRTFYLADYEPIELRSWAESIRAAFSAPPVRDVPLALLSFAARIGDVLKHLGVRNPPLTTFRLANMTTDAAYDLTPLQEICGAVPYGVQDGVRLTVQWMRQINHPVRNSH
jgi:GlcNAc-P-P-Und epimerase